MDLSGKVILITGGAGGIGLSMVKKLLENGVKGVAIIDLCEEAGLEAVREFQKTFGTERVIFIKADITVQKEFEDAFESTINAYNQLDIVINNAGIINEKEWKKAVAVNLTAVIEGTYLAMQNLSKYRSAEEGVIVNVASIAGLASFESSPVYSTTKHGLVGLGQALGGQRFYQKYKFRILTLCPGFVTTPLLLNVPNDHLQFAEDLQEALDRKMPIFQSPDAVGEALLEIIKRGKTGSIWVAENEKPVYEIAIPHRSTMKIQN